MRDSRDHRTEHVTLLGDLHRRTAIRSHWRVGRLKTGAIQVYWPGGIPSPETIRRDLGEPAYVIRQLIPGGYVAHVIPEFVLGEPEELSARMPSASGRKIPQEVPR